MIKLSLKILAIVFLFIFQVTLLNKLMIFGSLPNLILIFSIAFLLRNRFNDAILVAAVGGLLLDLVSPLRFGIYTLLFLTILILLRFLILKVIPILNLFWVYLIFISAFLMVDLLILLLAGMWPSFMTLTNVLINGLWGILIYLFLGRLINVAEEIKLE